MRTFSPKVRLDWTRACFGAAIGLLLLNMALLWLAGQDLFPGVTILYWPRLGDFLLGLRILTCLSMPFLAFLIANAAGRQRISPVWTVVVPLLGICAFANYAAFFVVGWPEHIGTVHLNGKAYHLAKISRFDENNFYYLGQCDQSGYWCTFHEIYWTSLFRTDIPAISLSQDAKFLVVEMEGHIVYTYDGKEEWCADTDGVHCAENDH